MVKRVYMTIMVDVEINEEKVSDCEHALQDYVDSCYFNIESQTNGVETYDVSICEANY